MQFWGDWVDDTRSRISLPLLPLSNLNRQSMLVFFSLYSPSPFFSSRIFTRLNPLLQNDFPHFQRPELVYYATTSSISLLSCIPSREYMSTQHLFLSVRAEQQNKLKQTYVLILDQFFPFSLICETILQLHGGPSRGLLLSR